MAQAGETPEGPAAPQPPESSGTRAKTSRVLLIQAAAVAAVATLTSALLVEPAQANSATSGDDATLGLDTGATESTVATRAIAERASNHAAAGNRAGRNHTVRNSAVRKGAKRLSHRRAAAKLRDAGIRWRSTGECSKRKNPRCTSFRGIRPQVISGITIFERASGCRVTVTGGTEAGHASGRYSHRKGYKIDIARTRCVDRYITDTFRYVGKRGDGARLYRATLGRYARESGHWDIQYR